MKHLAFIIAVYVFTLNLAPCVDYAISNDVKTEVSDNTNHHHEDESVDSCSPFCICQCCHANATDFQLPEINLGLNFISTQDFFYQNRLEKDFTTSILQPPKA